MGLREDRQKEEHNNDSDAESRRGRVHDLRRVGCGGRWTVQARGRGADVEDMRREGVGTWVALVELQ